MGQVICLKPIPLKLTRPVTCGSKNIDAAPREVSCQEPEPSAIPFPKFHQLRFSKGVKNSEPQLSQSEQEFPFQQLHGSKKFAQTYRVVGKSAHVAGSSSSASSTRSSPRASVVGPPLDPSTGKSKDRIWEGPCGQNGSGSLANGTEVDHLVCPTFPGLHQDDTPSLSALCQSDGRKSGTHRGTMWWSHQPPRI